MDTNRVTAAAAELYAADPEEFTDHRKALAAAARDAGDRDAAKRIGALRKPTRPAWIVNRLARADPGAVAALADLAAGLRAAAQAKDGRALRELSTRRGELIDGLTGQALAGAGISDPPAALREDVVATLTAALADPGTAALFASGTLTRAAQWAGFGLAPAADGETDDGDENTDGDEIAPPAGRPSPPSPPSPPARRRPPPAPPDAAHRPPLGPRRAQAPDETAARRRKAFADAERSLAAAVESAAAAGAAEDRLETTVRDLEDRLTRARAELADARLRARRAEAAERKARQLLDRTPRPE